MKRATDTVESYLYGLTFAALLLGTLLVVGVAEVWRR